MCVMGVCGPMVCGDKHVHPFTVICDCPSRSKIIVAALILQVWWQLRTTHWYRKEQQLGTVFMLVSRTEFHTFSQLMTFYLHGNPKPKEKPVPFIKQLCSNSLGAIWKKINNAHKWKDLSNRLHCLHPQSPHLCSVIPRFPKNPPPSSLPTQFLSSWCTQGLPYPPVTTSPHSAMRIAHFPPCLQKTLSVPLTQYQLFTGDGLLTFKWGNIFNSWLPPWLLMGSANL